jgi:hypothetical protein
VHPNVLGATNFKGIHPHNYKYASSFVKISSERDLGWCSQKINALLIP